MKIGAVELPWSSNSVPCRQMSTEHIPRLAAEARPRLTCGDQKVQGAAFLSRMRVVHPASLSSCRRVFDMLGLLRWCLHLSCDTFLQSKSLQGVPGLCSHNCQDTARSHTRSCRICRRASAEAPRHCMTTGGLPGCNLVWTVSQKVFLSSFDSQTSSTVYSNGSSKGCSLDAF